MFANNSGFFMAPFAVDGTSQGVARWEPERLSARWLGLCRAFLDGRGASIDTFWDGALSHVRTKITRGSGVSMVIMWIRGVPAASLACVSGRWPDAEPEALRMFVDSLRKIELVRAAATSAPAFEQMLTISDRPLALVVPWPDPRMSDQDHEVIRELSIHLAGALLCITPQV